MHLAQQVAHEFNNLWMIVNGYAEVLRERIAPTDEESRSGIEAIQQAAERGIHTTSQLLSFGRPPSPHTQPADLHDLLRRWTLDAQIDTGAGAAPVSVDAAKLEQAVRDLIQFSAARLPHGVRINLSTRQQALISDFADELPRGQFVTLRIGPVYRATDHLLAGWCEPYFSEGGKASSIGLAASYTQLRQMGIWVFLERTGVETADFILHFPLVRLPEPPQPKSPRAPAKTKAREMKKLETVLMVDDEESIRGLVARVLGRQGYEVLVASSGEDAIRQAEAYPSRIHIVVSDVALPGISGKDLVAQVRRSRPHTRALYISGYTDDPDLSSGVLPPGDGFLQKPFTLQALSQTVRAVLDEPPG
jgi:hypothetical protein